MREWMYRFHVFLTSALVGGEWSVSCPGHFILGERAPQYPFDRKLSGPRKPVCDVEKRKILTLPGFKLQTLGRRSRSEVYVEHLAIQVLNNTKSLSGFPWPISRNPDNNLESPCIYNCNFPGGFVSIWGLNREYPKILSLFRTLLVCVVAMSFKK
jgi:hypothetical protein